MELKEYIQEELWDLIEGNFLAEKYTNAVKDSMIYLTELIREKSDLTEDGIKLIEKAFHKSNPIIKINNFETKTERSIQEGISDILKGLYLFIRNPRTHNKIDDTEKEAIKIILFVDHIISILGKSKSSFDIDEIIQLVIHDSDFVKSKIYIDSIINTIPKKKRYEVLIEIYNNLQSGDINNNKTFLKLFFKTITNTEIKDYLAIISNDLAKTSDDNLRIYILNSFPSKRWSEIEPIARIRTENRIIKSIQAGNSKISSNTNKTGLLATWCKNLFKYFDNKNGIIYAFISLLTSADYENFVYFIDMYMSSVWELIDISCLEELDDMLDEDDIFSLSSSAELINEIEKMLLKGNSDIKSYIIEKEYLIPDEIFDYLDEGINNSK